MRCMLLVKSDADSEAGVLPSTEQLDEMGRFNAELVSAGVLLAGEGLHPSSKGARVSASGGRKTVTDGPFAEANELVAGFWLVQVPSFDEAVEWARRCPLQDGEIEVRRVFEADDFGDAFTPEARETEERLRARVSEQHPQ